MKNKCPKCGHEAEQDGFEVAVRSGGSVVDVGFRCPKCGEEFGFEYFQGDF